MTRGVRIGPDSARQIERTVTRIDRTPTNQIGVRRRNKHTFGTPSSENTWVSSVSYDSGTEEFTVKINDQVVQTPWSMQGSTFDKRTLTGPTWVFDKPGSNKTIHIQLVVLGSGTLYQFRWGDDDGITPSDTATQDAELNSTNQTGHHCVAIQLKSDGTYLYSTASGQDDATSVNKVPLIMPDPTRRRPPFLLYDESTERLSLSDNVWFVTSSSGTIDYGWSGGSYLQLSGPADTTIWLVTKKSEWGNAVCTYYLVTNAEKNANSSDVSYSKEVARIQTTATGQLRYMQDYFGDWPLKRPVDGFSGLIFWIDVSSAFSHNMTVANGLITNYQTFPLP